jgi:GntR family transcriptional repressor for pyruvate dehydrogenase complex
MFKILQREETLTSRVIAQLEQVIVNQRLTPGERFPAERELAERFGVSRTVIREAVRSMVARGFLEVRHGSGAVVCKPSAESLTQSISVFLGGGVMDLDYRKVIEVRRALETEIAAAAAKRRTEPDLAALDEILVQTAATRQSKAEFVRLDIAFHGALAAAAHNELFPLLLEPVSGIMTKVRELGFKVPRAPERALKWHSRILERVRASDDAGARRAMAEHLDEAETTLKQALGKDE